MNVGFFSIMEYIFPVIFIVVFGFIIFTFYSALTGKGQSMMMKRQLRRSMKVLEDNKEAIKELNKLSSEIGVDTKKTILGEMGDDLKDIASMEADIESTGLEKKAAAIKRGLTEDAVTCRYCGAQIDADSRYCKVCGRQQ